MAYFIKPGEQPVAVEPIDGVAFTLEEMQRFVEGLIEILSTTRPDFLIVVNEEGRLRGMPANDAATRMVAKHYLGGEQIVGPCLIGTRRELGCGRENMEE